MNRHPSWLASIAAAAAFAASAAQAAPAAVDVAAADNAFGFRLLNAVQRATPTGNVILSPVSAALDLAMVLNGADGQTRDEMRSALSLDGSELDAINAANAALIKTIRTPAKSVTLAVADSLWVDNRRATLKPEYLKQTQASYDAEMTDLDFSSPGAAARINDWASEHTHGKITQVIDRIDRADLALLLNAVYFKGEWTFKFDAAQTKLRDFNLAGGSVKQLMRMAQSGRFEYRLPFGAGDLVMEVLLPSSTSSLAALEAQLTPQNWQAWKARFVRRPGNIELPRFELKSKYRLNAALQALGMNRAFHAGGADAAQLTSMFSPVPGAAHDRNFFISAVLQSVYWKVDEEGSEAAAVTTTTMRATLAARPAEPFRMIVDRPFFCAIEDGRSGTLLFVGAIYEP